MSDWFDGSGSAGSIDVVALLDSGGDAVAELVRLGALVSVGLTSDGGALGLTVTLDGRWRREYFRETEALIDWLKGAIDAVSSAPPRSDAPSAARGRSRGRRGA